MFRKVPDWQQYCYTLSKLEGVEGMDVGSKPSQINVLELAIAGAAATRERAVVTASGKSGSSCPRHSPQSSYIFRAAVAKLCFKLPFGAHFPVPSHRVYNIFKIFLYLVYF